MEFSQRLAVVLKLFGGNTSELARQAGIKPTSAARWISGQADPQMSNLVRLAESAGVSLEWLATGKGEPFPANRHMHNDTCRDTQGTAWTDTRGNQVDPRDFVFIPYYDVQVSAGSGVWVDNEHPEYSLAFRRDWLEQYIRSPVEQLSVVRVKGDSMLGVLDNNDAVLVDHCQNHPGNGLYVVRVGNELFAKRTQLLPHGRLKLTSANSAYEPFEVDLSDETADVKVIGKIVWLGRNL